jgi:hypothetical protein
MARKPLTRHWTPEETERLKMLFGSGATPLTAALKLRRTLGGITTKISEIRCAERKRLRCLPDDRVKEHSASPAITRTQLRPSQSSSRHET